MVDSMPRVHQHLDGLVPTGREYWCSKRSGGIVAAEFTPRQVSSPEFAPIVREGWEMAAEDRRTCGNCGRVIQADLPFCGYCGHPNPGTTETGDPTPPDV